MEFHKITYLAADTIFIDCVIFWIFLTDLSRMEMAFNVAMLRFCWANAPFEMMALTTGLERCIHMIDYTFTLTLEFKKKEKELNKIEKQWAML